MSIPIEEMSLEALQEYYRGQIDVEADRLILASTSDVDARLAALGQLSASRLTTQRTFAAEVVNWKGRMYDRIRQAATTDDLLRLRFDELR